MMQILIHSVYPTQNIYFSETFSPKNHSQVSFDKRDYQVSVLVSFTTTLPKIITSIHIGEHISSPLSNKRKAFTTKLCSSFGFSYRKISVVGMKRQALKSKYDFSF